MLAPRGISASRWASMMCWNHCRNEHWKSASAIHITNPGWLGHILPVVFKLEGNDFIDRTLNTAHYLLPEQRDNFVNKLFRANNCKLFLAKTKWFHNSCIPYCVASMTVMQFYIQLYSPFLVEKQNRKSTCTHTHTYIHTHTNWTFHNK